MGLTPPTSPSIGRDLRCRLPGGRQGQAYEAHVDPPPGYCVIAVAPPPGAGLSSAGEDRPYLRGTLLGSGALAIEVTLQHTATQRVLTTHCTLNVVAAAHAQFKDLPPDPHAPGAKATAAAEVSGWEGGALVGASVRGRAHANRAAQREDDFGLARLGPQCAAFALSDGAGSARLAALASALAVKASLEALVQCDAAGRAPEASVAAAARAGCERLVAAAAAEACPLEDLGCTLIIGLYNAAPTPEAPAWLTLWQIGDGVVLTEGGPQQALQVLSAGDRGDYSGETQFLHHLAADSAAFAPRAARFALPAGAWIVACTDGISDPFGLDLRAAPGDACGHPQVRAMLACAREAAADAEALPQLLGAIGVFTPGDHDDRTLVYLQPGSAPPVQAP